MVDPISSATPQYPPEDSHLQAQAALQKANINSFREKIQNVLNNPASADHAEDLQQMANAILKLAQSSGKE